MDVRVLTELWGGVNYLHKYRQSKGTDTIQEYFQHQHLLKIYISLRMGDVLYVCETRGPSPSFLKEH